MSETIKIAGIEVPKEDWEATPPSIQSVLLSLSARLSELEEKLNQNSQNSSKPPSTDTLKPSVAEKRSRKQRQSGRGESSSRQVRRLKPSDVCDWVHEVKPSVCQNCGAPLGGEDARPHRHQEIELPAIEPLLTEYRLHQLSCSQCGQKTRASLPVGVCASGYGERLSAMVAMLSGPYRQSYRQVSGLMSELFGVHLSRGCIGRIRSEISEAVSEPVSAAQAYVQSQPVLHSDETGFVQGNRDGHNPHRKKGWLWVLTTPLVSFFSVALSRSQETAKDLIGEAYTGIVISDRCSAYTWIELSHWQVCWAHLKRDFTAIAERTGASQTIGEALLRRQRRLFRWWHRVRNGTQSREQFIQQVNYLRQGFKAVLEKSAALSFKADDKTPLAKTVRTCRRLLKIEPALWNFVYLSGVEPTNNAAERALRPAVIWRRTSFGSQSQSGSLFVARMLTVTASLKAQGRNTLDFLSEACLAARTGAVPPSLLPHDSSVDPTSTDEGCSPRVT